MANSGLWHGAAWTFVAWGIFHGLLSAGHKLWSRRVLKPLGIQLQGAWVRWVSVALMFQATTIGWIFFRERTFSGALALVRKMLSPALWQLTPLAERYLPVIAFLMLLHGAERWFRQREGAALTVWTRYFPAPVRALAYTAVAAALLLMLKTEESTFIYFRF
jgi:alginate O-acetyltransferase complex protein AlgI